MLFCGVGLAAVADKGAQPRQPARGIGYWDVQRKGANCFNRVPSADRFRAARAAASSGSGSSPTSGRALAAISCSATRTPSRVSRRRTWPAWSRCSTWRRPRATPSCSGCSAYRAVAGSSSTATSRTTASGRTSPSRSRPRRSGRSWPPGSVAIRRSWRTTRSTNHTQSAPPATTMPTPKASRRGSRPVAGRPPTSTGSTHGSYPRSGPSMPTPRSSSRIRARQRLGSGSDHAHRRPADPLLVPLL